MGFFFFVFVFLISILIWLQNELGFCNCIIRPFNCFQVRNIPPYGFLYYKQLQSLFRLCGHVKSISFDYSRYQEEPTGAKHTPTLRVFFVPILTFKQFLSSHSACCVCVCVCSPSEPMLSSSGHLRTRGLCLKCLLLSSWPIRHLQWRFQSTPQTK